MSDDHDYNNRIHVPDLAPGDWVRWVEPKRTKNGWSAQLRDGYVVQINDLHQFRALMLEPYASSSDPIVIGVTGWVVDRWITSTWPGGRPDGCVKLHRDAPQRARQSVSVWVTHEEEAPDEEYDYDRDEFVRLTWCRCAECNVLYRHIEIQIW